MGTKRNIADLIEEEIENSKEEYKIEELEELRNLVLDAYVQAEAIRDSKSTVSAAKMLNAYIKDAFKKVYSRGAAIKGTWYASKEKNIIDTYKLTIYDIARILKVRPAYVQNNILKHLDSYYYNPYTKKYLKRMLVENEEMERYYFYITKKIIIDYKTFLDYLKENVMVFEKREAFNLILVDGAIQKLDGLPKKLKIGVINIAIDRAESKLNGIFSLEENIKIREKAKEDIEEETYKSLEDIVLAYLNIPKKENEDIKVKHTLNRIDTLRDNFNVVYDNEVYRILKNNKKYTKISLSRDTKNLRFLLDAENYDYDHNFDSLLYKCAGWKEINNIINKEILDLDLTLIVKSLTEDKNED